MYSYTTEWLLECTLLRIKSPSAYKHLRESKLLPLPHPKTIQRLLLGSPCEFGFNDTSMSAIQREMCNKSRKYRQGVLSFDEIKLRKSLDFNKGTLKFDGFINYGELTEAILGDDKTTEFADHALVFMYRPYNSNWVSKHY